MNFAGLANRLNRRFYRRKHRRVLQQWWADGGDARFRYDYDLTPGAFVMDLGGYQGEWAAAIHARYRCRIAVFEPVAAFAASLRSRFEHSADVEVFGYGLGASSRTETIYLRGASTSMFRKRAEREAVRIVDVQAWFDEHRIGGVQLMKVNIEGGEFELLERLLETGAIARIANIQVQFHNVAVGSTRRMQRIQAGLRSTHEPTYQYTFVWENWVRRADAR